MQSHKILRVNTSNSPAMVRVCSRNVLSVEAQFIVHVFLLDSSVGRYD